MIIRKIKPEELKRTRELFAIAFEFASDDERTPEEIYRETITNPKSREDICWQERWAAFEDDDTTMLSFFVAKPMPIHFDGHHCTMVGIGGVATLPQYRRRGGIRACFKAALPDMYANGAAFSYLYPFSTAYYRKFGYEMGCQRTGYSIRLNHIPSYEISGNCYLSEPGNTYLEDIRNVYTCYQQNYNMMVENEAFEYSWVTGSNPVKDQVFTYVYKSASGEPKAFMTFSSKDCSDERHLICQRFFFTDMEGFKGLLSLARSFASDHHMLCFWLPLDQNIAPLLPEWSFGALQREILFHGMARVINVQHVLEMARYQGSGRLVIEVGDSFIPQNNHRFLVEFTQGAADSVSITEEAYDVSLGIGDFSRLIIGAFAYNDIACMESIKITANRNQFDKVFYSKPNYITESF